MGVVGVEVGDAAGGGGVDVLLGKLAGGIVFLQLQGCAAGDDGQVVGEGEAFDGLGGVLAILISGVGLDGLDGHVAPHAVAAAEGDGLAGEGGERVGVGGIGLAPDKGLHAAHEVPRMRRRWSTWRPSWSIICWERTMSS